MELEIIDTVTADCIEPKDIIRLEDGFCEVKEFDDRGDIIVLTVREIGYDDDDTAEFSPSARLDLYGYVSVEV